ncbi:CPBP family intramembrane glutamic endopeptidase [Staphylococcus chromogenes]|uniref:CPBP family intramembrane glutamic endopeptidase n=2 Tax=Staphylococcus chromogenes TaxID=46126 RepID=UPI00188E1736|nr:type II CAAX endopeptidase family protein [Staphylococcus chromogenes]HDF3152218.1 CPBP family intramembrane metalloprotease [Staphylococcus aureus]
MCKSIAKGMYDTLKALLPFIIVYFIIVFSEKNSFVPNIGVEKWLLGVILSTIVLFVIFKTFFLTNESKTIFDSKSLVIVSLALISILLVYHFQNIFGFYVESENEMKLDQKISRNKESLHYLFVDMVIVAPVVEEIALRGMVYYYIKEACKSVVMWNKWKIKNSFINHTFNMLFIVISTSLFTYIHSWNSYIEAIPYFSMGIILSLVLVITKNILNTICIHMLNNSLAFFDVGLNHSFLLCFILVIISLALFMYSNKTSRWLKSVIKH